MKGILMKPEMILAIQEGRKTQTRRIIKSKHESGLFQVSKRKDGTIAEITSLDYDERSVNPSNDIHPRYNVGEVIYIKEGWCEFRGEIAYKVGVSPVTVDVMKDYNLKWGNAMFMPENAARTFLKITNIRTEKLFDITDEDAEAEGVKIDDDGYECWDYLKNHWGGFGFSPRLSFDSLWIKINGIESWNSNPYVFVYEFQKVERT